MKNKYFFKKCTAVLCVAFMAISFGACGSKSGDTTSEEDKDTTEKVVDVQQDVDYTTLSVKDLEVMAYDKDAEALYYLGQAYDYGTNDTAQNFEEALDYYTQADELGSDKAAVALGYMYLNGVGVEQDGEQAYTYFTKAVEAGNAEGNVGLGRYYLSQFDVDEDTTLINYADTAVEESKDDETADTAKEETAETVQKETAEAALDDSNPIVLAYNNIQNAYKDGLLDGKYYMGYLYEKGVYVTQQEDKAIELYKEVSDAVDYAVTEAYAVNEADVRLGMIYIKQAEADEENAEELYKEANNYFKKAADNGYAKANYYLGIINEKGIGQDRDYEAAMTYFLAAADKDFAPALNQIGYMYFNGQGVDTDYTQAVYYQKLAAVQDYTEAQVNLGYMYENGYGVEMDLNTALAYYKLAADKDFEGAKEAVARVENQLNE